VDRKKSPALTSPGKVGFFVALLLVVTAIGVSYFITGSFGLQWSWVEFAGASPTQWSFHLGAFIDEMVPLIALVALLSFAAYVLVSGAVRRYQSSVSSGSEYRDLLRSFKGADDFDDENKLDELKKHPELREFVMGFKNRIAARERQLDEREKRSKDSAPRGGGGSKESAGASLAHESSLLLNAIVESKNGMGESPGLTIPELKQIERAVREKLARSLSDDGSSKRDAEAAAKRDAEAAAKRDAEARHELDNLKASVDTTLAAVRAAVASARRDAGSCVSGAREIESQLAALQQAVDALAVPSAASNGIAAALKRVDTVTESLAALSEETKRIAIAAALSASGGGAEGDAIKVAEDIRTIATRFNGIAQQWKEASPAIRNAIDTIASSAAGAEKRRAVAAKAIDDVVAKTRLWGERLVALAGAVDGLDRAAGSGKSAKAAPAPAPASPRTPQPAPAPKAQEDWGNLAADLEEEVTIPAPPKVSIAEPDTAGLDEDFVTQSAAAVFEETGESGDEAPFADIPGFEQDKHLFADSAGRKSHHEHDNDPRFVVEREAGGEWDLARGTQAAEREAGHGDKRGKNAAHAAPAPAPAALEDEGFLTGPGPKAPADKPIKPSKHEKVAKAPVPPVAIPVAPDPDADAIDLYALGAVDAVAGVHA